MRTLEELYNDLERYKDFDKDDNAESFLDTVDAIVLEKEPSSLPILLKYFNNGSAYSWVLESLINRIEYYDDEIYTKEILSNLGVLLNAKEWMVYIIAAILNQDKCRQIFKENLHLADKELLLKLFDVMEEESPHHRGLIAELRQKLDEGP